MKKSHSAPWLGIAIVFIALLYSVLLFALKKEFTLSTWVAYAYTLTGFVALLVSVCFDGRSVKEYPMLRLPKIILTLIYFGLQVLIDAIQGILLSFLSIKTVFIIRLILLAVYIVALLLLKGGKSYIQGQDEYEHQKIFRVRKLNMEIEMLSAMLVDERIKEKLFAVQELLKYGDPMSSAELSDIEERIEKNIYVLRKEIEENETEKIEMRIDKIQGLVAERNAKCRMLKE